MFVKYNNLLMALRYVPSSWMGSSELNFMSFVIGVEQGFAASILLSAKISNTYFL